MHTAHMRGCNLARHRAGRCTAALLARSVDNRLSVACRAAAAAGISQLTPRQRRVEAKRKLKEAKRAQQQQQQQQQGHQHQQQQGQQQQHRQQQQATLPPSQSNKRRHSPADSRTLQKQQQQQDEAGLPDDLVQLLHDLCQSAKQSRGYTLQQLQAGQPAAAAVASKLWAAHGAMTEQQLADLAWSLAHFDLTLQARRFGWDAHSTQQQTLVTTPVPASQPAVAPAAAAAVVRAGDAPGAAAAVAAGDAPDAGAAAEKGAAAGAAAAAGAGDTPKDAAAAAAAVAAGRQPLQAAGHVAEAAQQVQQLSAACHAAMATPFRVYPGLFPSLQLAPLMEEVQLRQDYIYLEGGTRQVPEARLTGWQSDIGATFCYSGKEMQPQGPLTLLVAQVRDRLAALTGEHYDSVLVNYYPDGKCGMRFHVDPLYGVWTPHTAVVSIGHTRTFVFRDMEDHSRRWVYEVSNGDVVVMFGDCQEVLQHAIKVEREARDAGPRMSLVYKQNIQAVQGQQQASL